VVFSGSNTPIDGSQTLACATLGVPAPAHKWEAWTPPTQGRALAPLPKATTASVLCTNMLKYSSYFCLVSTNYSSRDFLRDTFSNSLSPVSGQSCSEIPLTMHRRGQPLGLGCTIGFDLCLKQGWISSAVLTRVRLQLRSRRQISSRLCCNTKPNPLESTWMPDRVSGFTFELAVLHRAFSTFKTLHR